MPGDSASSTITGTPRQQALGKIRIGEGYAIGMST